MAFRDTLTNLRDELAAARAQRLQETQEVDTGSEQTRSELLELVDCFGDFLGAAQLLEDMNSILLAGSGNLKILFIYWEEEDDWEDEEDELEETTFTVVRLSEEYDEDSEGAVLTLSWEEGGERAIEIEVGDRVSYLMVNGVEIPPKREDLEKAIVEAFQMELGL